MKTLLSLALFVAIASAKDEWKWTLDCNRLVVLRTDTIQIDTIIAKGVTATSVRTRNVMQCPIIFYPVPDTTKADTTRKKK